MGFSSMDDFLNEVTVNGKFIRTDWVKATHAVTVQAVSEWYQLFTSAGNPTNGVLSGGTNLSFQSLSDQSPGALLHGGNVAPDTKHILNASAFSASATTMPAVAMLVDLLGYYPMTSITTGGDQAAIHTGTVTFSNTTNLMTHSTYDIASFTRVRFTTSGTLPAELSLLTDYWTVRQSSTTSLLATSFANAIAGTTIDLTTDGAPTTTVTTFLPRSTTGAGVQCFITPTTVMGSPTPTMRLTYQDSDGNNTNITPGTLPLGRTLAPVGMIAYSGTGSGKYGPFMPLAAGDKGIRAAQQLNISATWTSGALSWVLCKPLATLPMTTLGVASERDFMNQLPSLPRVEDGACLAWLLYNGGGGTPVSTPFNGAIDFGWG